MAQKAADGFETYPKSKKHDQGKEYEHLMCAFYAIKLSISENVKNFNLSTNNNKFLDFDDVVLEVEFTNGIKYNFLFQLKYKQENSFVTDQKLNSANEFSIRKCLQSFSNSENSVFILSTNAKYKYNAKGRSEGNMMSKCNDEFWMDVINSSKENRSSFFQLEKRKHSDYAEGFGNNFFLLTNQANIINLKSSIEKLIESTLKRNISNNFIKFMKEWSLKEYLLTKDDVIAKLTEITLSPWIQTLTSEKSNEKSKLLADVVMKLDLTIVNPKNDLTNKIWNTSEDYNIVEVVRKYDISDSVDKEKTIALWYLNIVPLVVEVNKTNKGTCIKVASFLSKCQEKRRIVLEGDINKEELNNFEGSFFENLSNLSSFLDSSNDEQETITFLYTAIIQSFQVSLQGREEFPLQLLLEEEIKGNEDETKTPFEELKSKVIEDYITMGILLNMTQSPLLLGNDLKKEELPEAYVSRNVSTFFLNTTKTIQTFRNDSSCFFIFNCDANFKQQLQNKFNDINFVETTEYLNRSTEEGKRDDQQKKYLILVSTKYKCTSAQFSQVCKRVSPKSSHVYLLQVVSENDSILLLKLRSDNKLSAKQTMEAINYRQELLKEGNLFKFLNNWLNIFVAPPGIGKSTLFTFLSQKCPPEFWCVRVNLISHIGYLRSEPKKEDILAHFLELTEDEDNLLLNNIKKHFLTNRKLHIFFDSLDEIDSTCVNFFLEFIKTISSEGIRVWVSSRENLRGRIMQVLNTASIAIQELTKEEQTRYIEVRLKDSKINVYKDEEIKKIIAAIFRSKDIPSIGQLLGIPLQLYIITENFRKDKTLYEKLEKENIFVLTKIYKMFFENKKDFQLEKTNSLEIEKQIGYHFEAYLQNYEIPAVKAVLNDEDFKKLDLDVTRSSFLKTIKNEGDKFGIIKQVDKHKQFVYVHQTFAEYFACVWFSRNLQKVCQLKKELFSEKYENLRYIFDIMLAEENPLHLAIIYKSVDLFNKHITEVGRKDKGGRNALHLASCYGNKYPVVDLEVYKSVSKENPDYVFMIEEMLKHCDILEEDKLLQFNCIEYAALSHCLYVIEKILQIKEVVLEQLHSEYKSEVLLAYYSAELGYLHLLNRIITKDPKVLLFKSPFIVPVLQIAVRGSRDDETSEKNYPKDENVRTVKTILDNWKDTIRSDEDWGIDSLNLSCRNGWYKMVEVLLSHGAICSGENTILHLAAEHGQLQEEMIALAKDFNIDVDSRNERGETALHLACIKGKPQSVKRLLDLGADINALTKKKSNMMHYAARTPLDTRKILKILVGRGMSVNDENDAGESPLHLACMKKSWHNVMFLLDNGANVNAVAEVKETLPPFFQELQARGIEVYGKKVKFNKSPTGIEGQTPLHVICERGKRGKIAQLLLTRGADVNILIGEGDNFLHYTLKIKSIVKEIVEVLLNHGISINSQNKKGETPLHLACENNHLEIVKLFLERNNCDPNILTSDDMTVLHYAAKNGLSNSSEIISLLVKSGVDVNFRNLQQETALLLAWCMKNFSSVKTLIVNGANVEQIVGEEESLHFALKTNDDHSEIIVALVDNGVNVNAKNSDGESPLHVACQNGSVANVATLLQRGADVKNVAEDGMTVLHYAVKTSYPNKEVIMLLKEKVDVNASNLLGETALHISCKFRCSENVKTLLNHGASLNVVNNERMNALHYAVMEGDSINIIRLLISRGIKINAQNVKGTTPLHIACSRGLFNVAKLLISYNANVNLLTAERKNILHYAARSENFILIEEILKADIDKKVFVDSLYQNNRTTLHYAVLANGTDDQLLNSLIDSGVDVYAKDIEGKNALDFAFENGYYAAVGSLLKTGLFAETVTLAGLTSLHYSVYSGCSSGVEIFLQKCTDLDGVNISNKDLPLSFATENGRLERALLLELTNEVGQYISGRHATNPVPVQDIVKHLEQLFSNKN